MGYYRRYYTQRDYAVTKVAIKSAGGNGIECIFFEDHGEKMIINNKYVTVGSDNTIVTEDSVMVEDTQILLQNVLVVDVMIQRIAVVIQIRVTAKKL